MKLNKLKYLKVCFSQCNFVFIMLMGWACPLLGQAVPKKILSSKDFGLWYEMTETKLSVDGSWASFNKYYNNQPDTLIVKSTISPKTYSFEDATYGNFNSKSNGYALIHPKKGIGYLNLIKGTTTWFPYGVFYNFSNDGNYLGVLTNDPSKSSFKSEVFIVDLKNDNKYSFPGGSAFEISPDSDSTIVLQEIGGLNYAKIVDNRDGRESIVKSSNANSFSLPVWQVSSEGLAFISKPVILDSLQSENQLFYYSKKKGKLIELPWRTDGFGPEGFEISNLLKPSISEDGTKVFFYYQKINPNTSGKVDSIANVEIWHVTDKWLPPRRRLDWDESSGPWLAQWSLKSGKVSKIGDSELPSAIITADQKNAILYNKLQYEPQHKQFPEADLYLKDLSSNKIELIKERQPITLNSSIASLDGRFLAYFQDQAWWLFDINKKTHLNLTINIPFNVSQNDKEYPREPEPFDSPKWTVGGDYLLIYDRYDIWKIKTNGMETHRITNGRSDSTVYRLYNAESPGATPNFKSAVFDLKKELVLEVRNKDRTSGFAILRPAGNIQPLALHDSRITNLKKSSFNNTYIFQEESFSSPPKLMSLKGTGGKESLFYQSNQHADKFVQGKCQLISYENNEGKELHGILYFPDNYRDDLTYPMVVHIYEKLSQDLFLYRNPSELGRDGFNVRNFTRSGYFVLEPDITYKIGEPGISAKNCVLAALDKVIGLGLVKKDRIGLIGHSFGGYETSFIVSQTDTFAAAVSGAGAADLTSYYLTMGWNNGQPDLWRFEDQQWRMGKSYFEAPGDYDRNSPLQYVKNINTPLLLWSGAKDVQVNWNQNIELFLALRRLKKTATFMVYPDEDHSIWDPTNAQHLNHGILKWFDHYLK